MMDTDRYNGENSDFEDDVVEIDFEEQFVEDEKKRLEKIDSEIGSFGVEAKEEEDPCVMEASCEEPEQIGMDIPKEFQEEVEVAFPATQADIYDEATKDEEPYQDGLTSEDVVPTEELEEYSDANEDIMEEAKPIIQPEEEDGEQQYSY